MNLRSEKYYDEKTSVGSRTARNTELYKEISKTAIDNYEIKSNATVIGNNNSNIDVEKIKSILDTHYNEAPKRRSIQVDTPKKEEVKPVFETKEYDINVIIDKAKESKVEDYNEERSKKLRDTQYDILNNLQINREDFIEDYDGDGILDESIKKNATSQELLELINTIALNEKDIKKNKSVSEDSDPLDIFADLKGSGTTQVLDGLQEKTENIIKQIENTTGIDKSFYTKNTKFNEKDFEDFDDVENTKGSVVVKIVIALLAIIFIAGIVILVKSFL